MKTTASTVSPGTLKTEADKLADFVLFTQRACILDLSTKLNRDKISFPQFFLLTSLEADEYLTMSSIAQKMGHSTAAATGLIDRLEELGYVERGNAANDRRKIIVKITDKGRQLVASMRQEISANLARLMSTPEEASSFQFLRK